MGRHTHRKVLLKEEDNARQEIEMIQDVLQLCGRLGDALEVFSIPLFTVDEVGQPQRLIGTGFIVQFNSDYYLISAAHVLDEYYVERRSLHCFLEATKVQQLKGAAYLTTPPDGDRENDSFDVGIVRLQHPIPSDPCLRRFVPYEMLQTGVFHSGRKLYMVIGFPATMVKVDRVRKRLVPAPMIYWEFVAEDIVYKHKGLSPHDHILIKYARRHSMRADGSKGTTPAPSGMSGCPVWLISDLDDLEGSSDKKIVGIAIEHDVQNKCLVAVDIKLALSVLSKFNVD